MLAMATNYFRGIFAESYFTMQNYPFFWLISGYFEAISRELPICARAYFRLPES